MFKTSIMLCYKRQEVIHILLRLSFFFFLLDIKQFRKDFFNVREGVFIIKKSTNSTAN